MTSKHNKHSSRKTQPTTQLRPFHLLELPGEIRNRTYALLFRHCELEVLRNHPQDHVRRRKREAKEYGLQFKVPHLRLQSVMLGPQKPFNWSGHVAPRLNQPAHVLQTCRQVRAEAITYLYANTAFSFSSPKVLEKFLNIVPEVGKQAVLQLQLTHATYAEPRLTEMRPWKIRSDKNWTRLCKRMAEEMKSVRCLRLELTICDWPTQLNHAAKWAKPILMLKGEEGLDQVDIVLEHRSFTRQRLHAAARALENEMLTKEARRQRQHEEDLRRTREMEAIKEAHTQKNTQEPKKPKKMAGLQVLAINLSGMSREALAKRPPAMYRRPKFAFA